MYEYIGTSSGSSSQPVHVYENSAPLPTKCSIKPSIPSGNSQLYEELPTEDHSLKEQ